MPRFRTLEPSHVGSPSALDRRLWKAMPRPAEAAALLSTGAAWPVSPLLNTPQGSSYLQSVSSYPAEVPLIGVGSVGGRLRLDGAASGARVVQVTTSVGGFQGFLAALLPAEWGRLSGACPRPPKIWGHRRCL